MRHLSKLSKAFITTGISLFLIFALYSPALTQTWMQQFPTSTPPTPRYTAGNAYDEVNDRLIIFSGDDFTGLPFPNDVWVLTNATGSAGTPTWVQLNPVGGPPQGRFGGSTVYDLTTNRLIVHGGCAGNCTPGLADTWVLTNANGLGGTPNWIQLPNIPLSRAQHAAVFDPSSNRMIIFSGIRFFPGTDLNDVWVLTDANGIGSPTWVQLSPSGTPPTPRSRSAAVYDRGTNRTIVFGGRQFPFSPTEIFFNDIWVLTNANGLGGTPQWIQLTAVGTPPAARADHALIYDSSNNRMIVFGGRQSNPNIFFNDVWVLTNANGLGGTPQWIQLAPTGVPPLGRFSPSAGYSSASNQMIVAMGRNDNVSPRLFNDVWVLTNANGIIEISIDIKPGSDPNSINPNSKGVIPVAIHTTDDFDATTVDPLSVEFGPNGATESHGKGHIEDADGDADLDMVLHFKTQKTGIQCGDTDATLTGTANGQNITGTDAIQTVGCSSPKAVAEDEIEISSPEGYALYQNYPNPFNPETEIRFNLPEPNHVSIRIYKIRGEEIRILVDSPYATGEQKIRWDGKDDNGNLVSSGVYLYRIKAGSFTEMKKMTLIR